jgi:predicted DNA-binding transcriptional regulator AlpA
MPKSISASARPLVADQRSAIHKEAELTPPAAPLGYAAILSIKKVCSVFNFSRQTFWRLRKGGLGPTVLKVGRRRVITLEAAREWAAQRLEAPNNP